MHLYEQVSKLPNHEISRVSDAQQLLGIASRSSGWCSDLLGWLYLAVVLGLFSRQVIGWSMGSRIDTELMLNALLMAL